MVELSKEAQELLLRVQTQNQQLQDIMLQKQSFELKSSEIDEALVEIKDKNEVYREVAGLLIKADKEKVKNDLEEEKEAISVRKKQINKLETELKNELEESQKKLMEMVQENKSTGQFSAG